VREYSTREVAEIVGLHDRQIRRWAQAGLVGQVKPTQHRWRYSFQDLALLRTASRLLAGGLTARRVTRALRLVREQLPAGRPLSAVRIVVNGRRVTVRDRLASWEPESRQGTLDFDVKALTERVAEVAERDAGIGPDVDAGVGPEVDAGTPATGASGAGGGSDGSAGNGGSAGSASSGGSDGSGDSAQSLYESALDLELAGREREARRAYEAALERNPRLASARINLGRLLHAAHAVPEAEALYRTALEHEPGNALAAFNLGVALEDQSKVDAAIEAYQHAVAIDADYADAHFNLSHLLEARGDRQGALRHLSRFRRLMQRDS
jgi:DNA-binding transcriptional MerR regulator